MIVLYSQLLLTEVFRINGEDYPTTTDYQQQRLIELIASRMPRCS